VKITLRVLRGLIKEATSEYSREEYLQFVKDDIGPNMFDAATQERAAEAYANGTSPEAFVDMLYDEWDDEDEEQHQEMMRTGSKDDRILYMLAAAFMVHRIDMEDVRYIRYRVYKQRVVMEDVEDDEGVTRLGHMHTDADNDFIQSYVPGMTTYDLGEWLASHGARKLKLPKRRPQFSMYD
jgi:hypothetical protein